MEAISGKVKFAIFVSSLGYFIDIFDVVLFTIVRIPSLRSIGIAPEKILETGVFLLNMQLIGMIIGGLSWGILGDKVGRVHVLFGSILLYSAANIGNAFVDTVEMYALLRFLAGLGLAGEVGAGVTLIAELMPKSKRGIGTSIFAAAGTFGACFASVVGGLFDWRTAYMIGGCLGLVLLVMRVSVFESGIFEKCKDDKSIRRGDIMMIAGDKKRAGIFACCLLSGIPLFFLYYVVVAFSPEVAKGLGITGPVTTPTASLIFFLSMTIGDVTSGLISQKMQSRKKVLSLFLLGTLLSTFVLLNLDGASSFWYYLLCIPGGFFSGYWAIYLTTAAEQFGTNLRATVATAIPNFVRAAPIIMSFFVASLKPEFGLVDSLQLVGIVTFVISIFSLVRLNETFHVDLDFTEERR